MPAIHRIVQEVVRTMLDGEAVQQMREGFQYELVKRLVACQKQQAWSDAATLIEHAVHVVHHVHRSGHASSDTVALLANVAGDISNIHQLEEALAITARIPEPADPTAVTLVRSHADKMVDAAHALMSGGLRRQEEGLATEAWGMQAAESMIDRAEALLRSHNRAGPDILAHVVHRRAVLAWTRHLLGHPGGNPELCRTLMRESLNLFEAADQAHAPLAVTARQFLELREHDFLGKPDTVAIEDGPPRVPAPPLDPSGGHRISDFPWDRAVALTQNAPADACSVRAVSLLTPWNEKPSGASPSFRHQGWTLSWPLVHPCIRGVTGSHMSSVPSGATSSIPVSHIWTARRSHNSPAHSPPLLLP